MARRSLHRRLQDQPFIVRLIVAIVVLSAFLLVAAIISAIGWALTV
jgi:hypothetical protein